MRFFDLSSENKEIKPVGNLPAKGNEEKKNVTNGEKLNEVMNN